jgi:hypothetical protein
VCAATCNSNSSTAEQQQSEEEGTYTDMFSYCLHMLKVMFVHGLLCS